MYVIRISCLVRDCTAVYLAHDVTLAILRANIYLYKFSKNLDKMLNGELLLRLLFLRILQFFAFFILKA